MSNYTDRVNAALWLRDDTGHVVYTGDSAPLFRPVWNLCNPAMIRFINEVILREFMESEDMAGSFFDRYWSESLCVFNRNYSINVLSWHMIVSLWPISLASTVISFNNWPEGDIDNWPENYLANYH